MKGNQKVNKKPLALVAAIGLAFTLAACGSDTSTAGDSTATAEATSVPTKDTAGINELPVGDSGPQTNDALTIDLVYFQAVDMEHGSMAMPPAAESDMHFEVDVVTNEKATEWGYEPDQFMPYLDISAEAVNVDTGQVTDLGTMMPMIAADGPHYGNNIKLAPGNYDVIVTVASPADQFMLHTGKDSSGVQGRFWVEPLTFEFQNWQWDGQLI